MCVTSSVLFAAVSVGASLAPAGPGSLLAYAGPAAGLEFLPYLIGLLAWVGVAVGAALSWPLAALRRRLREGGSRPPATPQ